MMENIVIRKISGNEAPNAMKLALEVFMQFEAPDYHVGSIIKVYNRICGKLVNVRNEK